MLLCIFQLYPAALKIDKIGLFFGFTEQGIIQTMRKTRTITLILIIGTAAAGILGILLGVYTFAHPMFGAFTAGMLIGLFIIEIGISLMSFGMAVDKAD